jgi:argininosuccinate lyase
VKKAVDEGLDSTGITTAMVEQGIMELLDTEMKIDPESIRKALDPWENIEMRCLPGGPAYKEVTRMLDDREKILNSKRAYLSNRQSQIAKAYHHLHRRVEEMISENRL